MKHRRLQPVIFCSNNPGLTMTYFAAKSNFATPTFIWEHVPMMSLEIIASCDLGFGLYSKLND